MLDTWKGEDTVCSLAGSVNEEGKHACARAAISDVNLARGSVIELLDSGLEVHPVGRDQAHRHLPRHLRRESVAEGLIVQREPVGSPFFVTASPNSEFHELARCCLFCIFFCFYVIDLFVGAFCSGLVPDILFYVFGELL